MPRENAPWRRRLHSDAPKGTEPVPRAARNARVAGKVDRGGGAYIPPKAGAEEARRETVGLYDVPGVRMFPGPGMRMEVVEAAGVEPASETDLRRHLRV